MVKGVTFSFGEWKDIFQMKKSTEDNEKNEKDQVMITRKQKIEKSDNLEILALFLDFQGSKDSKVLKVLI